jgi:hypothetical protein
VERLYLNSHENKIEKYRKIDLTKVFLYIN